ncbi:MAG TPA: class I SAM-dependent methyltransferase [Polyangiaceae bacterium LLY-WYZ-15_(1-7)]|nr:hypothetical protein [Sandaracinus sp.]HJL05694.1 class I SAM-dependent methyltransferase [Polyangiaceae bacterium LLY-WYZ-15_(1-7)]MBJ72992.1 hypothetical protein [Sandaracinus sp.]HJL08380.1 class I SAM-dependent methyltransferase [Polyangiaceae bacterium LLY-WYZ-15_(1-7)]HJL21833.1 class I SAM-dependent methyltransferase [Polyangiaceae bacterium LLY-WYZ-15_(1-7)]
MSMPKPSTPPGDAEILDLLAEDDAGIDLAAYFDPREFAFRETLETTHYWHVYRRELIRRLMDVHLGPGTRAIELGCGTGNVATHLNRHGYVVDYGDVHREGLEAAARRVAAHLGAARHRRYVRLDITRQFPPAPDLDGDRRADGYDAVLLFDVLEHLPDDQATLRHVRRHLRPGAHVVFTVPAFQMLWSPWDDTQKHKRRYTLESARALAEESGFALERLTYFFFPLFFAAGGVKLLRELRSKVLGRPAPVAFDELLEAKTNPALNAAALRLLELEARWLMGRDLPCGTSVFALARAV